MKRVIFIDPGEKCGWARADIDGNGDWHNLRHGITPLKDMALSLYNRQVVGSPLPEEPDYDIIGYEVFRLYRTHALQMIGNDMQTSQVIGMIRMIAWLSNTRLVSQGANVMTQAEKSAPTWLKKYLKRFPKVHDESHDASALLHLWHWTFKNTNTEGKDAHKST